MLNKYSKTHVSNLCPRQGAGGVQCCARFISNKISLFALKKNPASLYIQYTAVLAKWWGGGGVAQPSNDDI